MQAPDSAALQRKTAKDPVLAKKYFNLLEKDGRAKLMVSSWRGSEN